MTRYSPIIGYLLAWQLALTVLCSLAGVTWWLAAVTALVFGSLVVSRDWERNSYSFASAIAVVVTSLALAAVSLATSAQPLAQAAKVLWVYAMVACTATSPYPLAIRMPVIIYTLAYLFMVPQSAEPMAVFSPAAAFSAVMCVLAIRWKISSHGLTTAYGPPEPPYSFSLATAIVAAVFINMCVGIAEYYTSSKIAPLIGMALLTAFCIWLLCAGDWNKNPLAVSALLLMITLHAIAAASLYSDCRAMHKAAYVLSVAPVMFHTTAPVFRGMRIVITLFAVYAALNRHTLIAALAGTALTPGQQHAVIIGIDALLTLVLFLMALHWRKNTRKTPNRRSIILRG